MSAPRCHRILKVFVGVALLTIAAIVAADVDLPHIGLDPSRNLHVNSSTISMPLDKSNRCVLASQPTSNITQHCLS